MTLFSANAEQEAWERHERCLELEDCLLPRSAAADPVTYSHNVNAADSFERLGNLLHAIERQLREVVEGTWEEQELCFRRFSSETFEHATKAADAVAEFKRQVFAESERYKELNRGT